MNNKEAVNWLTNVLADIGKAEHSDLWHYEQALTEIKDMLESAQLSQEGTTKDTTSDTISKTETVEHLRRMLEATVPNTDYDEGFIDGVEFGISTVSTMPTVQPVATDTNVGDTISRQAAIDAINSWRGRFSEEYNEAIDNCENSIIELPPVQPEPKKGEWIEISSINHTYKCSECGRLLVNVADGRNNVSKHYPYCHCGADMRGEQQK